MVAAANRRGITLLIVISLFVSAPTHYRRARLKQLQTTASVMELLPFLANPLQERAGNAKSRALGVHRFP
jgi:hypothetical protein